jgi:hypothetical protein
MFLIFHLRQPLSTTDFYKGPVLRQSTTQPRPRCQWLLYHPFRALHSLMLPLLHRYLYLLQSRRLPLCPHTPRLSSQVDLLLSTQDTHCRPPNIQRTTPSGKCHLSRRSMATHHKTKVTASLQKEQV